MRFGVREICDVVFKAKSDVNIGNTTFYTGQPVLYIDSATASTVEGAATTVYAQGGKGNARLIAWEGEKTLTFTVTDALLSPIGFAILSGAGLFKGEGTNPKKVHVHKTITTTVGANGDTDITDALEKQTLCETAPIFVVGTEADGSITGTKYTATVDKTSQSDKTILKVKNEDGSTVETGKSIFIDCYVTMSSSKISELQIEAGTFAGSYYVEASTLFRRQSDGVDMPVEITFPNVKLQSNFTFSMAPTGDPSTFDFTMDAFPGYTAFDKTKKVLMVMQVVEEVNTAETDIDTVMGHTDSNEAFEVYPKATTGSKDYNDSVTATATDGE